MMLMASALTNHWIVGGSAHHGYTNNSSGGCFKVLAWNRNVLKGKQFLPREKVASTGWQITRAVPKNSNNAKWWETDMKANMKNIKSQEDLDEQLLMAGDNLTVVHFFSPNCPACKALHSKVHQLAGMYPGLQFLMVNYDEHREIGHMLNVHVLPMFRFYRGEEGRICSFSCTISTIHKFKGALKRHGAQTESPAAEKGSAKNELKSSASTTEIPNEVDASQNLDIPNEIDPSQNLDIPNEIDASQNLDEDAGPTAPSNE